jgi:pre-mRNA-splicing factor 38A
VLKLLQIQPEKEIVVEFIKNEDFKYVRALGAFYMRMVGKPLDVYQVLKNKNKKYEDFKYVRALGAFYMRMVGKPIDAYQVRGLGNAFLNRL